MIDPKKQYRTRDGREVRILMTDGGDWYYPVIAAYKDKEGRWWPLHVTKNGCVSCCDETPRHLDLIEVKPRIKRKVWVNVYPGWEHAYSTKRDAEIGGGQNRIACVEIDIDVEEGHGL